jgi:iron(III) transport system substrate-binding protein
MYWRFIRVTIGAFIILFAFSIFFPQEGSRPKAEYARTVTVYAAIPSENLLQLTREFEKTSGIKVLYVSLPEQDILPRLRAEKTTTQADVWLGGALEHLLQAKKEGLLLNYVSKQETHIPHHWRDQEGYWTGLFIDVPVFISNKDIFLRQQMAAPNAWQDLLDTRSKFRVGIADPGVSNATYTMLAALQQRWGTEKAFDFLTQLHRHVQQYPKMSTAPGRMVGMGEMNVGILGINDAVRYVREGFPITITFPKEDMGYQLFGASIIAGAPHSQEAKVFLDWLVGKEGQALLISSGLCYYPTNSQVKPAPELLPLNNLDITKFNAVEAAENKMKLIEKWNVDVRMGRLNPGMQN